MFTVVSYDIVEDKRRTKVLKLLRGFGTHVQYSVFECDLTPEQLARLQRDLLALIDVTVDSVRLYRLDLTSMRRTQVLGVGRVTVDPLYYFVDEGAAGG